MTIAAEVAVLDTDAIAVAATPPTKIDAIIPLPDMARTTIDLSTVFYSKRTMNLVSKAVLDDNNLPLNARGRINATHFEGLIPLDVEGGSLAKRIRNYLHKEYDYKASDALAQEIGDIAVHAKNLTFEVDLTKDFSWNSGDFGDAGSCMWGRGDYARARCITLPRLYASALRFYRNDAGRGRLWIIPVPLDQSNGYQAYVMSNYYGENVTPARVGALMTHLMHRLFPNTGAWETLNVSLVGHSIPLYVNPAQPVLIRQIGADTPDTVTITAKHLDEAMPLPAWATTAFPADSEPDYDPYDPYDDYDAYEGGF